MNWFDIFIIIVVIYSSIRGYRTGLIRQLTSLAGLAVAAILSGKISGVIEPHLQNIIQIPSNFIDSLSYTLSFLIILAFFYLVGTMLETIIKTVKMGKFNKLCGSILCLSKWLLGLSVILNIVIRLDDKQQLTKDIQHNSFSYQYIQPIAPLVIPYLQFNLQQ